MINSHTDEPSHPRFKHLARLMVFIDGGYLRENFKRIFDSDFFDCKEVIEIAVDTFNQEYPIFDGDLIRVYYYDGIVDPLHENYEKQMKYFEEIRTIEFYEVRLGRLIPSGKDGKGTLKQKGVDVKLASDMIVKAYQNHYDFAVLFAGDDDF